MNSEVLNSWKEIAAYLGRGVRTVQRWERELGLPVRRPRGKERSAVIALTPDLDRWLHKVPQGTLTSLPSNNEQKREKLHLNTERLLMQVDQMVKQSSRMQEIAKTTLILTSKLRQQQAQRRDEWLRITERRTILLPKAVELPSRAGETPELPKGRVDIQKAAGHSAR